jgi:hypothetical protein
MRYLAVILLLGVHSSAIADSSLPEGRSSGVDLLQPRPLAGPFPTLAGYCAAQRKAMKDPDLECSLDRPRNECAVRNRASTQQIAPFLDVKMISVGYSCELAIRTARGWFVDEVDWIAGDRDSTEISAPEVSASGPGATPQVLVRVNHARWWHENDENITEWLTCQNSVLICGVGASGAPTCMLPLPLEWAEYCEYAESDNPRPAGSGLPRWKWRMVAALLDSGKLSLRQVAGRIEHRAQARKSSVPRSSHETPDALRAGLYQLSWP